MTGIERLQGISMAFRGYTWGASLSEALGDIASQIKREHAEDCFRMGEHAADGKVGPKTLHEIALSLLYGWDREAVDRERDRRLGIAADVSMSAYDLLPEDEREAVAWVREHGGLDAVRRMFQDADSRRVELCGALDIDLDKGWSEAMAAMRRRLMPEGMEWLVEAWPRFEDGEPVRVGDEVMTSDGVIKVGELSLTICDEEGGVTSIDFGERVKRPAPKVLDADGVEIRVGDTVWPKYPDSDPRNAVESAEVVYVHRLGRVDVRAKYATGMSFREQVNADQLTHRAPVLAADGKPLREGEAVYGVNTGYAYTVTGFNPTTDEDGDPCVMVVCKTESDRRVDVPSNCLTHERPQIDSWELLEEDAAKNPFDYCKDVGHRLNTCENAEAYKARDIVRRAKALAGDA